VGRGHIDIDRKQEAAITQRRENSKKKKKEAEGEVDAFAYFFGHHIAQA